MGLSSTPRPTPVKRALPTGAAFSKLVDEVLEVVVLNPGLGVSGVVERLEGSVDTKAVSLALKHLKEAGKVVSTGQKRGTVYSAV